MTEVTFRVPDMSCAHCKAAVEEELYRISGVARANADVENGVVVASYDEDRVGRRHLIEAIEEAGYTVAG